MDRKTIDEVLVGDVIIEPTGRTIVKEVRRYPPCGPTKVHINDAACWPSGTIVKTIKDDRKDN